MSKKKTAKERDSLKEQLLKMASDPNSPGSSQAKRAAKKKPAEKKAASRKVATQSAKAKIAKTTAAKKKVAKQTAAARSQPARKPEPATTSVERKTETAPSESDNKPAAQPSTQGQEARAIQLVERFAKGAMVPGAIPIPLVDAAVISGVQLKMLHSLCKMYNTPFSTEIGRAAIASIAGGAGSAVFGMGAGTVVRLLLKSVPLVGMAAGMAGTSGFGYATTYGIGKVFVEHFEGGGTLLDFDARKVAPFLRDHRTMAGAQKSKPKTGGAKSQA